MLKSIFLLLTTQYLKRNVVEIFFCMALLASLSILTLLFAATMLFIWQWPIGSVFAACISPWLILLACLGVFLKIQGSKIKQAKKNISSFQNSEIVKQVLFFFLDYILRKKS